MFQKPNGGLIFLNLLVNTIMGTFFGIYTWNNPDDSECYSWPESDAAVSNPIGIENAKDVTRQFHIWFMVGFIISAVSLVYSFLAIAFLATKKGVFLGTANSFFMLALLGNLGWTVCGTVFRFKHHGKVCSGDYFNSDLYSEVPPFQWKSGRFMIVYLIILWSFWGLLIVGGIFGYVIMLLSAKKKDDR